MEVSFDVRWFRLQGVEESFFGERYRVVATESGSRLDWDFLIEPGLPRPLQKLLRPVTQATIDRIARDTRTHLAQLHDGGAR